MMEFTALQTILWILSVSLMTYSLGLDDLRALGFILALALFTVLVA